MTLPLAAILFLSVRLRGLLQCRDGPVHHSDQRSPGLAASLPMPPLIQHAHIHCPDSSSGEGEKERERERERETEGHEA